MNKRILIVLAIVLSLAACALYIQGCGSGGAGGNATIYGGVQ